MWAWVEEETPDQEGIIAAYLPTGKGQIGPCPLQSRQHELAASFADIAYAHGLTHKTKVRLVHLVEVP
jgi:hypothetical protein